MCIVCLVFITIKDGASISYGYHFLKHDHGNGEFCSANLINHLEIEKKTKYCEFVQ